MKNFVNKICNNIFQDISLLNVLTIDEALHHFGLIYGMSEKAIENKIKFLASFLDLPDLSRQIQHLRYANLNQKCHVVSWVAGNLNLF